MPTLRVTRVSFSDGSTPMYFINGRRDHDIQDDDAVLEALIGHELQYIERINITNPDENNPEPWEDLWYAEREEDLYQILETYRELEE